MTIHRNTRLFVHIVEVKQNGESVIFSREIFSVDRNLLSPEILPQRDLFGCVGTFPTQKIPQTAKMVPMGREKSPGREKISLERENFCQERKSLLRKSLIRRFVLTSTIRVLVYSMHISTN